MASPISFQFNWFSSVAVAIVLGDKCVVPVVCSVVLSKDGEGSCEALQELLPDLNFSVSLIAFCSDEL